MKAHYYRNLFLICRALLKTFNEGNKGERKPQNTSPQVNVLCIFHHSTLAGVGGGFDVGKRKHLTRITLCRKAPFWKGCGQVRFAPCIYSGASQFYLNLEKEKF
ncbi:hypothetical protein CEXT_264631 [Caerostris extrusa]|uniref:Uncharacterized protein n=1 Tax=Caerostris extrusa TaxID=172846 RepID=A0AAV4U4E0_CAEEX|nr:hypothetical protein CEXT_264631 [Caerostris extrusa]